MDSQESKSGMTTKMCDELEIGLADHEESESIYIGLNADGQQISFILLDLEEAQDTVDRLEDTIRTRRLRIQ